MTDTTIYPTHAHPPHNLISWPAVLAGAIVAAAVGAMLNLLGIALGAASFNPYDLDGGDASDFTAAAGMWMAIANSIALFVGGVVASRAAKYSDHHRGGLHGVSVWAVAFLLALVITASGLAGGAAAIAGGEASEPPTPREVVITDGTVGPNGAVEGQVILPPQAQEVADETADATATLALWGFLTMLLGAVAAVLGGMYGTRNHRWMTKAGIGGDGRDHDHGRVVEPAAAAEPHRVYPTPRT
ncbi:hypothetical protein [Brevundimonas sp.]|uniref:hypothetical protein n=1 Tax=Brevundimonas sp. TaxID=1871086 RepID=UPI002D3666F5|nr:hypothetical protein [Brevundimonas sp.]HYC69201.1 hypothetical protein [Brevundimonas sp.]